MLKKLGFILSFVILVPACTTMQFTSKRADKEPEKNQQSPTDPKVFKHSERTLLNKLSPVTIELYPGHVKHHRLTLPSGLKTTRFFCDKESGIVTVLGKDQRNVDIFFVESYFSKLKSFQCFIDTEKTTNHLVAYVDVKSFQFPEERLFVDKKRVKLSAPDQRRVAREQKKLNKIYAKRIPHFVFSEPFIAPLNSFLTSRYGAKRLFNKSKRTQHLGNDFRAAIGVKIPSANSGYVVFAGDLFYSGKTVIINHGLGLFSTYGHLSKILVSRGDYVARGSLLGKAGMSGRVTGPHLHWGVKFDGHWIDGFSLVDESKSFFSQHNTVEHASYLRSRREI